MKGSEIDLFVMVFKILRFLSSELRIIPPNFMPICGIFINLNIGNLQKDKDRKLVKCKYYLIGM